MRRGTSILRPFLSKQPWRASAGTTVSTSTTQATLTAAHLVLPTSRECIRRTIEKSSKQAAPKGPQLRSRFEKKSSTYPRGYASGFLSPAASLDAFLSSLLPDNHARQVA